MGVAASCYVPLRLPHIEFYTLEQHSNLMLKTDICLANIYKSSTDEEDHPGLTLNSPVNTLIQYRLESQRRINSSDINSNDKRGRGSGSANSMSSQLIQVSNKASNSATLRNIPSRREQACYWRN